MKSLILRLFISLMPPAASPLPAGFPCRRSRYSVQYPPEKTHCPPYALPRRRSPYVSLLFLQILFLLLPRPHRFPSAPDTYRSPPFRILFLLHFSMPNIGCKSLQNTFRSFLKTCGGHHILYYLSNGYCIMAILPTENSAS